MDMRIVLGEGSRVEAVWRDGSLVTDEESDAPEPFDLFLASIGTCTGRYVSRFCRERDISTAEIRIVQRAQRHPETKMVERIEIDIELPADFPPRYRKAVLRAAELCSVKKHLARPPTVAVRTREAKPAPIG